MRRLILSLVLLLAAATAATAQEPAPGGGTAESAPPDGGAFVAKVKGWADDTRILDRISGKAEGWYPRLGGLPRGSGFTFGPGYRTGILDDRIFVDLSAGFSLRGYRAADANLRWLQLFGQRVELWTDLRYQDYPQEDFFGTGMTSTEAARTSYAFTSNDVAARLLVKPLPWLRLVSAAGYMRPEIGSGTDPQYPSIEERFTDVQAPGLTAQPHYLHTTMTVEANRLDVPGNPRAGGIYTASFGIWDDRTLDEFDFHRFDLLLTHYVPLNVSRTHVLSGRVGTSYVNNRSGDRVPFYFLAYAGGRDTIRSLREFRLKDENALWLGAEYRWIPATWVSLAAFTDAGKVSADWQDLNLRGLKAGYGVGVRVHSRTQTFASVDVATGGGEGWRFFIKLGPSF